MEQGEEAAKTRPDPADVQIQERGEIFFFYRPKVSREEAHSAHDVQRLYILLRPDSGDRRPQLEDKHQSPDSGKEDANKKKEGDHGSGGGTTEKSPINPADEGGKGGGGGTSEKSPINPADEVGHGSQKVDIQKLEPLQYRLIVMGKKSLPDPGERSRPYWGFVEMVTTNADNIRTALRGGEYDTRTRGRRRVRPARALAEGVYRILRHRIGGGGGRVHTHLVYKLELPPAAAGERRNEPQEALNVEREGSFVLQIKNPEHGGGGGAAGFRGLQSKRKAVFPAHLQGRLGHRRFAPADPPDFLNYEGCEFLLISASDDIGEELGLEITAEPCSDLMGSFGETASVRPLLDGTWD